MKAAIFDYICRKAQEAAEAKAAGPPCDLRCQTRELDDNQETGTQEYYDKCDLRCTKETKTKPKKIKKKPLPEYVGPAHFTLYDPPDDLYVAALLQTAFINLAYFFMGATVIMILFHTLAFKHFWPITVHILFITIGSQLFIPVAFLMQNPLDGAAIWMKRIDRLKESFIMEMCGIGCIFIGTSVLFFFIEYRVVTFHSFFGFGSALLYMVQVFMLLITYMWGENFLSKYAKFVSIPSFSFGTLAFISGIFQRSVMQWYPAPRVQIPTFLTLFCLIYSTTVIYGRIKNFVQFITTPSQ